MVKADNVHLIGNASPHDGWEGVKENDPYKTDEYKRCLEAVRDGYLVGMKL